MRMNLPEKSRVSILSVVYKEALMRDSDFVESVTRDSIRHKMAEFILRENIKTLETEFTKEYSLDLYVLSYDELVKLVREEAMDYVRWLGPLGSRTESYL